MFKNYLSKSFLFLLGSIGFSSIVSSQEETENECKNCFKIRIERPVIIRRATLEHELDTGYSFIKLPNGKFRGWSSNQEVYRIEASSKNDMFAKPVQLLGKGAANGDFGCGLWLTGYVPMKHAGKGHLLGFVHQETECDYPKDQTFKSFGIATSTDYGKSWNRLGTIIESPFRAEKLTYKGEGGCRGVLDEDTQFVYLYCLRQNPDNSKVVGDLRTIVVRSHITTATNLKSWRKWHNGSWNEPAIKGDSTSIDLKKYLGFTSFNMDSYFGRYTGLILPKPNFSANEDYAGLLLSLSQNYLDFFQLNEPLLILGDHVDKDKNNAREPRGIGSRSHSGWWSVNNVEIGGTAVSHIFDLNYGYLFDGSELKEKYLVKQTMRIDRTDEPQDNMVGVALSRYAGSTDTYRTTTKPVRTEGETSFETPNTLGYVLTKEPPQASYKLHECYKEVSNKIKNKQIATIDYYLAIDQGKKCPDSYKRHDTIGWVYRDPLPNTLPLYRCSRSTNRTHYVSTNRDCNKMGKNINFLGYILLN